MFAEKLVSIWSHLPENINPIAFSIGIFSIRWYSLMYLVAFGIIYLLLKKRIKNKEVDLPPSFAIDELFIYLIAGLLVGGRLGYLLLYQFSETILHPLSVLLPFQQGEFVGYYGVSYHGGLIGVVLATFFFCKRKKISFIRLADFVIPAIPLGYFFGRIGNFLNGELFGRITSSKIGMYFPLDETNSLRHPSQLYEALLEGLLIFVFLWSVRNSSKLQGKFFSLYLVLYGLARFIVEFFRQPDPQLGFIFLGLTMGQILSALMILAGMVLCKCQNQKTKLRFKHKN